MMTTVDQASLAALDPGSLRTLEARAKTDPQGALKDAAKQFEALFMQMMLKAMRDTVPEGGLTQSNEGRMYQELLDQQWAQQLAARGMGLADLLTAQLSGQLAAQAPEAVSSASSAQAMPVAADRSNRSGDKHP
jgi:flagellar protein FlgJ